MEIRVFPSDAPIETYGVELRHQNGKPGSALFEATDKVVEVEPQIAGRFYAYGWVTIDGVRFSPEAMTRGELPKTRVLEVNYWDYERIQRHKDFAAIRQGLRSRVMMHYEGAAPFVQEWGAAILLDTSTKTGKLLYNPVHGDPVDASEPGWIARVDISFADYLSQNRNPWNRIQASM